MADGLGHGLEARLASAEAVRQLYENPELPPKALLTRVHQALRSTRGAAVAIAYIDSMRGKLTFAGVGNISARIYAGSAGRQNLVSLNGTAGHQCDRIQDFSYPWPEDGLLVLHSDGLSTATGLEPYPGLAARDPALIAGLLYRDFCRGRDDATVVVAKAG
jgi:serine phosphatase RsbU (regulator of sigma subunit)